MEFSGVFLEQSGDTHIRNKEILKHNGDENLENEKVAPSPFMPLP